VLGLKACGTTAWQSSLFLAREGAID
jgi:hypothetical protein